MRLISKFHLENHPFLPATKEGMESYMEKVGFYFDIELSLKYSVHVFSDTDWSMEDLVVVNFDKKEGYYIKNVDRDTDCISGYIY